MSTAELDTYLLQNWMDLEAAAARGFVIDEAVREAIADEVRSWAEQRGWSGVFSTDAIWLSAPEWTTKVGSRPAADAWFMLDCLDGDDERYWLTALTGSSRSQAGFVFRQNRMPAKTWKAWATAPDVLASLVGFSLQTSVLFHPLRLDSADVLEGAASGTYAQAAAAVSPVLDRLEAAASVITQHLGPRS